MVRKSFLRKIAKLSSFDIILELTIPRFRIIVREPFSKAAELLRRQLADLLFYGFNSAHRLILPSAVGKVRLG